MFTLLTPTVVHLGDYKWLIALRVLEGLGEVKIKALGSKCMHLEGVFRCGVSNGHVCNWGIVAGHHVSGSECSLGEMGAAQREGQNWNAGLRRGANR